MPKMMKAQIVKAPYEMEYTEVPVPEISDDEVLIKVKVCGICGSDTSIYTGKYAKDKLPLITGHEFWGRDRRSGKKCQRSESRRQSGSRYLHYLWNLLLLQTRGWTSL